jgi:endonuclease/exonuclease/phosphatase (EEP) superfamily protein YafD
MISLDPFDYPSPLVGNSVNQSAELNRTHSRGDMATLRKNLSKLLIIGSLPLVAVSILCTFFARYSFVGEMVNNFRGQLAVIVFGLASVAFALRGRRWSALLLVVGVIVVAPVVEAYAPCRQPPPGNQTIRLMSFNVLADNKDPQCVLDRIAEFDADILVILEYANDWPELLRTIDARYPFQILKPRWHGFGLAIYSKLPLQDTIVTQLTRDTTDNVFATTTVVGQDFRFRLAAAHLLAPWDKNRLQIRNRQIEEITNQLRDNSLPLILAGDFNGVPWSPYFSELLEANQLSDSRRGFGYHGSWPAGSTVIRIPIDHVFASDRVHISRRETLAATSSDHLPVLVEFSIAE